FEGAPMTEADVNLVPPPEDANGTNTTPESVSNASLAEAKPSAVPVKKEETAKPVSLPASVADIKPVPQNETLIRAQRESKGLHPGTRPHALVVMPFGKKTGADNQPYDFKAIYQSLIKPALEDAGFEAFRGDE